MMTSGFTIHGFPIERISNILCRSSKIGLDMVSIKNSLLGGWDNVNLLVHSGSEKYVLKIPALNIVSTSALYERMAMLYNCLSERGLAPHVIEVGLLKTLPPIPFMLLEYIEGTIYASPDQIPDGALHALKEAHDRLAALKLSNVPSYKTPSQFFDSVLKPLTSFKNFFDFNSPARNYALRVLGLRDILSNGLSDCPWSRKLMHGDLSESNIVFTGQEVVFLDVSYLSCGEPMYDIAYLSVQNARIMYAPPYLVTNISPEGFTLLKKLALFSVICWSILRLHHIDIGWVEPNLATTSVRSLLVNYIDSKLSHLEKMLRC